uniref:Ovule protein n=1 Tax=Syphacia muris TaxID=451379 RepID=A0A0N5AEV6_9BILA
MDSSSKESPTKSGRRRTSSCLVGDDKEAPNSRERHFSFSGLVKHSSTVDDALKRDSKYLTDGDGYQKEKYVRTVASEEKKVGGNQDMGVDLDSEMRRQNRILHNEVDSNVSDGFEKRDYISKT